MWLNGNGECCKVIYADGHMRYDQSRVRHSWQPEEIRSVTENASERLCAPLGQRPIERSQQASG